jgi:hypothetical protein
MRTLRKGMSGEDVRYLQYVLGISADGSFGPATETAVKNKQKQTGLVADGSVGPATQKRWGLSAFIVHIYDKSQVWFAGTPYNSPSYPLRTLKQWAELENADRVYNLAFYNLTGSGSDQYGPIRGRTLTYLKAKGYDVGYGGTSERITINSQNICAGYKLAIKDCKKQSVSLLGKRTRRANGELDDGRYIEVLSLYPVTEAELRDYVYANFKVKLLLIQDGGGSGAFYDAKADVLISPEGRKENSVYGRSVASVVCVKEKAITDRPIVTVKVCPCCGQEIK